MSPPQKKDRSPFPPCKKMLTFSFKSATSACSLRLLELVFCFLSLASNSFSQGMLVDDEKLQYYFYHGRANVDLLTDLRSVKDEDQYFWKQQMLGTGSTGTLYHLFQQQNSVISSANDSTWLKEFMTGRTDGSNTEKPVFQTLYTVATQGQSPALSEQYQNLQYFLSLTLGQFFNFSIPRSGVNVDFDLAFTTNSTMRDPYLSAGGSQYFQPYGFFTVWLAEAQRRLISNTTITNDDWRALNLSSNPVQVLRANLTRQEEMESTISNEVSATESQIEELFTVDQPSTPSGYDNADDFSDVADDLGSDDDSLSLQGTIRLASSSDIANIVSSVGLHYTGPHAEISLSSHAGGVLASAVSSCNSVMSSVWQWIAALFIFRYVVYWYRKIREVLLQSSVTGSGVVQ